MTLSVNDRGSGGNNTAATSFTGVAPNATITAGNLGVLVMSADNAGSGGGTTVFPATITDSKGNVWTRRQNPLYDPAAASAGVDTAAYTCLLTTNLLSSDNANFTFAASVSVTAKAYAFKEVVSSTGRAVYNTGGAGTGAGSGTPTVTTGSITSGSVVIGWGGAESADTWAGDADSTNGSWSTHVHTGFGTGTSGMSLTTQHKVVTATATQTYNPTLTSADQILGWIRIDEAATQNLTIALLSQTASTFAPVVAIVQVASVGLITQTASTFTPTVSYATAPPTTVWTDTFTRTIASGSGWGTADTGGAYTHNSTTGVGVDGSVGYTTSSALIRGTVNVGVRDSDVYAEIRDITTLEAEKFGVIARMTGGGSTLYYLWFDPTTGAVQVGISKFASSTHTVLAGPTSAGFSIDSGGADTVAIRAHVTGINPTLLRVKAWKVGTSEPSAWTLEVQDSSAGLQVRGALGIILQGAGAGFQVNVDNVTGNSLDSVIAPALINQTAVAHAPTVNQPYIDVVVADGPAAYWRLDEASGNFIDYMESLVLTPGGAGTQVTYNVTGPGAGVTPGISFDGSLDGATSPDDPTLNVGNGPFSLEFWFKRTRTAATEYIMAKHANPGVTDVGWRVTIASADDTVRLGDGAGGTMVRSSGGVTDTLWHHCVITKSGSTQKLYLDGADVSAGVNVHTLTDATDQLVVGRSPSNGSRLIGSLDDIAIYKTALTLAQVQNHYNNKDTASSAGANITLARIDRTAATFAPTVTSVATVSLPLLGARDGQHRSVVLSDSPDAYYRLGETSGATAADVTGSHPGSYAGSPVGVKGLVTGDGDGAVRFPTHNDYMQVAGFSLNTTAVSLEAKFTAPSAPPDAALIGKWNATGALLMASANLGGSVYFYINSNEIHATLNPSDPDYHVIATWDGTNGRIYVNGILAAGPTAMAGPIVNPVSPLAVAQYGDLTANDQNITVDEAAVYSTALSAAQVLAHSDSSRGVYSAAVSRNVSVGLINQTASPFAPTVTPGAAPVTIGLLSNPAATFTPTVTSVRNLTIGLLSNTAATFTPTVASVRNLTIALLNQTAATFNPTITTGAVNVSLGLINQTAATFTPTVTSLATYTPALINQTAATFTPTVGRAFSVALINQTAATFTPTVTSLATISVGLINQTATATAPTITTGAVSASVGLINQTAATFTPTVTSLATITVALINQTATASTPTVTTASTISVALINQTATPFAPTITTGVVNVSLGLINQTATASTPTVTTANAISVALINQTATASAPTVTTANAISVALINQTAATFAPTITTGAVTASVGIINQTAATFTPTVTTGVVNVSLGLINQTATASTPTVTTSNTISVALIDRTAVAFAPTVTTTASISVNRIDQTAATFAPSLSLTVYVPLINQTAQTFAPSSTQQQFVTLARINQTADTYTPSVTSLATISVALIDQTAVAYAPTVTSVAYVAVDLIDQSAVAYEPSVTSAGTIALDFLDQTAIAYTPTVEAFGTTQDIALALINEAAATFAPTITATYTIDLARINQPATTFAPSTAAQSNIFFGRIEAQAQAFAPTITTGAVAVLLPLIDRTAVAFTPSVSATYAITVNRIDQTAVAYGPAVTTQNAITVGRIDRTAQAFAPTVTVPTTQDIELPTINRIAFAFTPLVALPSRGDGAEIIIVTGGPKEPGRPARTTPARAPRPAPVLQTLGLATIVVNPHAFEPDVDRSDDEVLVGLSDDDLVLMT